MYKGMAKLVPAIIRGAWGSPSSRDGARLRRSTNQLLRCWVVVTLNLDLQHFTPKVVDVWENEGKWLSGSENVRKPTSTKFLHWTVLPKHGEADRNTSHYAAWLDRTELAPSSCEESGVCASVLGFPLQETSIPKVQVSIKSPYQHIPFYKVHIYSYVVLVVGLIP